MKVSNLWFLVDECLDARVINALRSDGFDVKYVTEVMRSAKDKDILETAFNENRILITNDKDFGELVYLRNLPCSGVILLRLNSNNHYHTIDVLRNIINRFGEKLPHSFSVVTENKIKIRHIKKGYF